MTGTIGYGLSSRESRRDFWKRFAVLLLVIAGQNVIVYGVNLLDNIMIGRIENAGAAISGIFIVNQIQFLLQMIVGGIADGAGVLCSRFWGEGNIRDIKKTSSTAMAVGVALSGLLTAAALLFPRQVLSLFTDKPAVIEEAAKYLYIVCFTYVVFTVTQVLLGVLRSVECAFIGFVNSCAAFVVNLTLNYILIFGHCGFPAMGVRGAAIATLISRVVELVIVIVYIAFFDRKLKLKLKDFFVFDRDITGKFMRYSLPVLLSATAWGIAMGLQTAILGRLEEAVISANSIASTVFQIVTVFTYASATAASIMIGKTIGEGGLDSGGDPALLKAEVKHRSIRLELLFLGIGAVTGAALFLLKDLVIGFYDISPATKQMAVDFMTVLSVTVVGTSYQMPSLAGILRGGGDTKFILYNDIVFMWGIVLPASFLAAFVLKLSPVIIFICLKSVQILKCFVAIVKVNRFRWIKKLQ